MSQNPEPAAPYEPAQWQEGADPEKDAQLALDNNDTRLLAFALRATNIPGISSAQVNAYQDKCGIRFIKGFGDVIRDSEALDNMKQASDYAERYNSIITTRCTLTD